MKHVCHKSCVWTITFLTDAATTTRHIYPNSKQFYQIIRNKTGGNIMLYDLHTHQCTCTLLYMYIVCCADNKYYMNQYKVLLFSKTVPSCNK